MLRKCETAFGFALHVAKHVAGGEQVRDALVATIGGRAEIPGGLRDLERPTHEVTARLDVSGPWHDAIAEHRIGPGLEAPEPTPFNQVIAELTKPISGLIVPETWPGNEAAQRDIGTTGRIGVPVFQA